jgi:hypothetical protein
MWSFELALYEIMVLGNAGAPPEISSRNDVA